MSISDRLKHFWHIISNIRPIVWISLYICLIPVFALIYWGLPDSQFRIPDGGTTDFGAWLYYSIVTITTLGFGDYTPMHAASQWVTAIEVMLGLVTIGFFLNAVGSMKSEIDVASELELQRQVHNKTQHDKLVKNTPVFLHMLNQFLTYCYAVTTPLSKRSTRLNYNENFTAEDMADMNRPSGLPGDYSNRSAIQSLLTFTARMSLYLDSLQSRIDLALWPQLLENCFAFVANYQMLSPVNPDANPTPEIMHFIRTNASLALDIETRLTQIAAEHESK